MALNIPEGITIVEFSAISNLLASILSDVGASQVSMRLNESQRSGDAPVGDDRYFHFSYFVGSVQDAATQAERKAQLIPDPGLYRFGDNVTSKEIREAVGKAVAGSQSDLFASRGWQAGTTLETESKQKKGMGSRGMGRESGLKSQKYIGIKIAGRCVGTLGVSFSGTPPADAETKIIGWARPVSSNTLTDYLSITFNLWGPTCY